MKIEDLIEELISRFPREAEQVKAWTRDYAKVLGHLDDAELEESFDATLGRWAKAWPPRPADFKLMKRQHQKRHPLFIPGNKPYNQMTELEFAEWRRQNTELFLVRLATLKTFARKWPQSEERFAQILRGCENADECHRVLDQWRRKETIDPKRVPIFDPGIVTAATAELGQHLRENRGMDPRITPECRAFLKDYDRRMAERRPTGQKAERGPTEEYRSDLPGAERRRAMLQAAADAHRRGVLDGTIKLAADYRL